jgi:hypothetical protein
MYSSLIETAHALLWDVPIKAKPLIIISNQLRTYDYVYSNIQTYSFMTERKKILCNTLSIQYARHGNQMVTA